jgi:hypothetical protein
MTGRRTLSIAVVLLAGLAAACGPGRTPSGQEPVAVLQPASGLDDIQEQFNAAADRTRVVLLLSPT